MPLTATPSRHLTLADFGIMIAFGAVTSNAAIAKCTG